MRKWWIPIPLSGSVFAYGLENAADYIAIEVPEPSSLLLAALATLSLAAFLRRTRA